MNSNIKFTLLQKACATYDFAASNMIVFPYHDIIKEPHIASMTAFIKFSNRFTTTFKCKHPIVLAPMGGISGSQLAGAVSAAGGMGFLGTGGQNPHPKLHYVSVGDIVSKLREAQKAAHSSTVGVGLSIEGCLDKVTTRKI